MANSKEAADGGIDWRPIEAAFRKGEESNRKIAKDHGISEAGLRKKADKEKWVRLSVQKTAKTVPSEPVRSPVRTKVRTDAHTDVRTPAPRDELTAMQRRFVNEYLIDTNATQAAIRAGYSRNGAQQKASELMLNIVISAEIKKAMDARSARTEITQDMVLQELAKLAFFDPRKLYDAHGNLIPVHMLDADVAAAVTGIDVSEKAGRDGEAATTTKRLKFADKRGALETVGRHLGLFAVQKVVPIESEVQALSDDEIAQFIKEYAASVGVSASQAGGGEAPDPEQASPLPAIH